MAKLTDLPTELLLGIASSILGERIIRNQSLKSLALVSRRLRSIAQEVLHRHVTIPKPDNFTCYGSSNIGLLARTLCERPNLAACVNELDVWVLDRNSGHQDRTCKVNIATVNDENCTCGWAPTARVCRDYMGAQNGTTENELYTYDWDFKVRCGHEPALCGLILSVCSNLKELMLNYLAQDDPDDHGISKEGHWLPSYMHPYAFFPHYGAHQDDIFTNIKALSNIKRVVTNCLAPWELVSQPQIRTLEVMISRPRLLTLTSHEFPGGLSTFITNLTINISIWSFEEIYLKVDDLYVNSIVSSLRHLRHLFVQMMHENWWHDDARLDDFFVAVFSYDDVLYMIGDGNPHLETLGVDISGLNIPDEESQANLSDCGPMTKFSKLPNLRKVIGPQELFLDTMNGVGRLVEMPRSIESIHIVDATDAFNNAANYIFEHQPTKFASLRQIRFWRHRLDGSNFPLDPGFVATEEDDGTTARETLHVWEYVDHLKRAGIDVVIQEGLEGPWKDALCIE